MPTPPALFGQFGQTLAFAERALSAVLRRHLAERQTEPETWYALQLIATPCLPPLPPRQDPRAGARPRGAQR